MCADKDGVHVVLGLFKLWSFSKNRLAYTTSREPPFGISLRSAMPVEDGSYCTGTLVAVDDADAWPLTTTPVFNLN